MDAAAAERAYWSVINEVLGFIRSRAVYAVTKLGVADLLVDGPKDIGYLADRTNAHAPSLLRVMRTLTAMGIFVPRDEDSFELNDAARMLVSDSPRSMRGLVLQYGQNSFRAWGDVMHAVTTGTPAFEHAFGMDFWSFCGQDQEANEIFNQAMQGSAMRRAHLLAGYPWQGSETVVDVGGGNGTLLIELLGHHPGLTGIVVDLPHVAREAVERIADAGLDGRCRAVGGDMFDDLPGGGDVYVLALILHDWDDDRATSILRTCRRAMSSEAKLLAIENPIPDDGDVDLFARLIDLHMLVETGGRERTEREWRTLLSGAGFELTRIHPGTRASILEALPS